jgi:hypothetical protein
MSLRKQNKNNYKNGHKGIGASFKRKAKRSNRESLVHVSRGPGCLEVIEISIGG